MCHQLDEGEEGTHNLDHYMQQSLNLMTNGDLSDSDEESSGISLTDFNVEDQQAGECVCRRDVGSYLCHLCYNVFYAPLSGNFSGYTPFYK